MSHVVLVHWRPEEAEERAEALRRAGHRVDCLAPAGGAASLRPLRTAPPDAVVIDLGRLPAQGRAVGVWLRQQAATRALPLLFVGGGPEKTRRARELLPDAVYSDWEGLARDLAAALRRPPSPAPVVPGTMDGYSGTPLPRKLGIKAGATVLLLDPLERFAATLGALPEGARLLRSSPEGADVVLLFCRSAAALAAGLAGAADAMADGGRLWLLWPKKASGYPTDLSESGVRTAGLDAGLVDYKIAAIDATWSGLCFARRRT